MFSPFPQICLISKEWGGIVMEGLTDADNFGIKWDEDLDVKVKCSYSIYHSFLFIID